MHLVEVATLSGHSECVWHASWSHDGSLLASCGGDKTIRIWAPIRTSTNSTGYECVATLEDAQSRTIRACEW